MKKGDRIRLLDSVRGLCVIGMIAHHLAYDLYLFGFIPEEIIFSPLVTRLYTPLLAATFMLISGICCRFSRSNIRRGIRTLAASLLVSAVSLVVGQPILFGVLHFFGCAMVIYGLCGKAIDRIPRKAALALWAVLFAITAVTLLHRSYDISGLWWLGIHRSDFFSADYYPLMPWIFMFFMGTVLGSYVIDGRLPARFYSSGGSRLEPIGRHALLIYLAHQPLCFGFCWLLSAYFN